jgi:cytidylate kinase
VTGRVIAIDGPAGSGKSTVARALAERLGLDYLDTGAMYRSVAFAAIQRGIDPDDVDPIADLARRLDIDVGEKVTVDGVDATIEIRGPEVTRAVSVVAANPGVRGELRDRQRQWVREHNGGVVEGRDIGTVVFPDADLKVFLTAEDGERARRRHLEAAALQYDTAVPVEAVQADIARRDQADRTRTTAPLAVADDAVEIDTTGRSVDDIVGAVLARLEAPTPELRVGQDSHGVWRPAPKGRLGQLTDRVLYRFVRTVVYLFARTYWRLSVDGAENLPTTGPFVIAPVHRSNVDFALVAAITSRRLRFMGKDSLWKTRPGARFLSALGAFPVHRGTADRDALRRCIEVIEGGEPLVVFPEGTRQSGPTVQELFEGAAYIATRTGAPIVPVGIGGSEKAMPRGSKLIYPTHIAIVIGKPIAPPPAGQRRGSRRAMRELTDRLYDDLQVVFDAAKERVGG